MLKPVLEPRHSSYIRMATQAAMQEQKGAWCEAAALWEHCADIARLPQNLGWARCRADFCRRKYDQLTGRMG
ncbi:ANR family transcriptional regulator [Yersinia intermedia]|uniref:ANR family transcriptional regulator n=1 Tax=Yersinia intermedia TaxID=631 RepID=UPI0022FE99EA|nr:ANR family transcriptional regulator [Yersinia intermedia]MDA5483352.1 ANR family transcriptional regulator [Yersinia intermedia]